MKPNVGSVDRIVRFIAAAILLVIAVVPDLVLTSDGTRLIVGLTAVIPLLTGVLRFCPLYVPAGIRTLSVRESGDAS